MPRKRTIRPDNAVNRKSKAKGKAQVEGPLADDQGVTTEGESQMNVTQIEAQEVTAAVEIEEPIPATKVEAGEGEVFAEQTESEEVVNATEEEEAVEAEGDSPTQAAEQPAPKPPKPSKRPYVDLILARLEIGDMDKKQLLALIMEKFPSVSRGGASTFLSDLLNQKYTFFRDRPVLKKADGKLIFEDQVPAEPVAEVVPEVNANESQAE
jgi:hypothetical protein